MTVAELIAQLQEFDPDDEVAIYISPFGQYAELCVGDGSAIRF